MSICQNLPEVPSPVHRCSRQTSQVWARQMSRVSGVGVYPGPKVLHSTRVGGRGAGTG